MNESTPEFHLRVFEHTDLPSEEAGDPVIEPTTVAGQCEITLTNAKETENVVGFPASAADEISMDSSAESSAEISDEASAESPIESSMESSADESLVEENSSFENFACLSESLDETAILEEPTDSVQVPIKRALAGGLPAALCDEILLQELAGIPNKMGFKIGEVAEMLNIKQYVLRYWETEFDVLKPRKAPNNQRYYTKKDVESVFLIRKLLHRDRFSIEGARSAMKELKNVVKKEREWTQVNQRVEAMQDRLDHLILDLRRLKESFH